MPWSDRLRRFLLGDPARRAAVGSSPVLPPDSVALQLVLRQVELDDAQAAIAYSRGNAVTALVGAGERERRRAIARKVRCGESVTEWEIIQATSGLANTLGPAGDAIRLALATERARAGTLS